MGLLTTAVPVVLLRWIPPWTSAVMILEPGPLADVDYRWVPRDRIAVAAAQAVIAAEDQTFLSHHGFDARQIRNALDAFRSGARLRGASTISQQVAKNLFLWNGRSVVRKGLEAWFTVWIEWLWPKERILEVYLNIAEMGPGVFGVEAASEQLLGTSADRLTRSQAARLAAVLPDPKTMRADTPGPYVQRREREIVEQMTLLDRRGHYAGLEW